MLAPLFHALTCENTGTRVCPRPRLASSMAPGDRWRARPVKLAAAPRHLAQRSRTCPPFNNPAATDACKTARLKESDMSDQHQFPQNTGLQQWPSDQAQHPGQAPSP